MYALVSGPTRLLLYKSDKTFLVRWVQGQWLMLVGAKSTALGAKQKGLLHPRVTDWFQRAVPRSHQCL